MILIGELHRNRERYPTPAQIVADETAKARKSFPNATSDMEALCFLTRTLAKNMAERTEERDRYLAMLSDPENRPADGQVIPPQG